MRGRSKRNTTYAIAPANGEMPDVITKLTPCVMMSPMSIAQYLPANSEAFDVVIFDEASQITVPDAIGAVARAKQAIVVGDPKQLSPTSFFSKKIRR